jgi:hypothetical protein
MIGIQNPTKMQICRTYEQIYAAELISDLAKLRLLSTGTGSRCKVGAKVKKKPSSNLLLKPT